MVADRGIVTERHYKLMVNFISSETVLNLITTNKKAMALHYIRDNLKDFADQNGMKILMDNLDIDIMEEKVSNLMAKDMRADAVRELQNSLHQPQSEKVRIWTLETIDKLSEPPLTHRILNFFNDLYGGICEILHRCFCCFKSNKKPKIESGSDEHLVLVAEKKDDKEQNAKEQNSSTSQFITDLGTSGSMKQPLTTQVTPIKHKDKDAEYKDNLTLEVIIEQPFKRVMNA